MFKKMWNAFTSGAKKVAGFVFDEIGEVGTALKCVGLGALIAGFGGIATAIVAGAGVVKFSFTIIGIVTFAILGWWKLVTIITIIRLSEIIGNLVRKARKQPLKGVTVNA